MLLRAFMESRNDPSFLGRTSQPYVLPVERLAIMKVARAAGTTQPWYVDEGAALDSRYGGLIAPPAYIWTLLNNMPEYLVYQDWVAAMPAGRPHVHTGDDYFYYHPARPGDLITGTMTIEKLFQKEGRTGQLTFIEDRWTFINQRNQKVMELVRKAVSIDPKPGGRLHAPSGNPARVRLGEVPVREHQGQLHFEDVEIGEGLETEYGRLRPDVMVMWGGAVDDYGRFHYDTEYAVEHLGLGGVLAAGPQMGAIMLAPVVEWIGEYGEVRSYLHLQNNWVFPYDHLFTVARVKAKRATGATGAHGATGLVDLELFLLDDAGNERNSGLVTVELPCRQEQAASAAS